MGTLYVDTSTLVAAAECRLKATLQYILHKARRGAAEAPLVLGTVLHSIEELRQKGAHPDEGKALLELDYHTFADKNLPGDDVRAWDNVKEIVDVWLEMHPIDRDPYPTVPGTVECGIAAPLDEHGDIVLVGRLDKLVEVHGGILVDDFKHTAMNLNGKNKERWISFYERAAQGPGYVEMTEQTLGVPVVGMQWTTLSIAPLPKSKSLCGTHGLKYRECRKGHLGFVHVGPRVYSERERAGWKATAIDHAKRFAELKMMDPKDVPEDGIYSGACERCPYVDFCKAGKPWDMLDAMYETHKWEPYKHAFGPQNRNSDSETAQEASQEEGIST